MVGIGFYALTFLAVLMVLILLKYHPNPKSITLRYLLTILVWATYLIFISNTGLLNDFSLPPRIPLLIVFPAILMILILTGRAGMQAVIQNTPVYLPVFLQSFRIIVELLIYGAFLEGIFPQRGTFEGLNFDILVGVSSIFIGLSALRGTISLKGIMIWNILSLGILLVTIYAFVSAYYFTDYVQTAGDGSKLVEFPYLLLPSGLLPIAIFLHVVSIRQVLFRLRNKT